MIDSLRDQLQRDGSVNFTVRVRTQAKTTRWKERMSDGTWKVDIAAIPEDGKANDILRLFVASELRIPLMDVEILSGQTSRVKRIRVIRRR